MIPGHTTKLTLAKRSFTRNEYLASSALEADIAI